MSASQIEAEIELFMCVLALLFNSCPYYWQSPSLAPLKAILPVTGCLYLHIFLAVEWNHGRALCKKVSVTSQVQFAASALAKMTLVGCWVFFSYMTLFLQLHSQIHRAPYLKSTLRKSRTVKSLVSGLKPKWKM